jgi:AAA family ATP:ADP antiporter
MAAVQAFALIGVAKGYEALARRVRRDRLVALGTLASAACLVAFHAADAAGLDVGVAFYLWLGAFQLLLIAQFWSFATDLYTPEQGRRIFAILGAGAALGSVVGAQLARVAMREVDRPSTLLLVAAVLLLVTPVLAALAHRRCDRAPSGAAMERDAGGIARLLSDPYLRLLAVFTILLNWVSTIGEYALDRTLLDTAQSALARGEIASVEQYVGAFKADYYAALNLVVLVLQLFAVSRILKVMGERWALAAMPVIVALGAIVTLGAAALAIVPLLAVLVIERVVTNGVQHSLQATARQSFYLFTSSGGRWSGKAFIDTVTWRAGDVLGAITVAALAAADAGATGAIACALGLAIVWTIVARALGREHRVRAALLAA